MRLGDIAQEVKEVIDPRNFPKEQFEYYSIPAYQGLGEPVIEKGANIGSHKLVVHNGTILFGKLNPRVVKVWMVRANSLYRKLASTEFIPLAPLETEVVPDYLYHICWSGYVIQKAQNATKGATPSRQRVESGVFLQIRVPLPPLSEQRAIVARLEVQMAEVERLRAAAERQLEAARALFGALLHQVFPYKEGDALPPGWRWVRLGEICSRLQYGFTAAAQIDPVGPRLLRITDIEEGAVDWDKVPYCACPSEVARQYFIQDGDILFTRTGGSIGKSYLVTNSPANVIFASYLIRVQVTPDVLPHYVYLYLQSPEYWNQVRQKTYGGVQPNMSASVLATIAIPMPPLSEQRAIVARLETQIAEVERLRAAAERQLEAVRALPGALLNEVFGGFEVAGD